MKCCPFCLVDLSTIWKINVYSMSASEGFTLLFPNRSFMDKYSQARTFRKNIILAADLNCDMLKLRSPEAVA